MVGAVDSINSAKNDQAERLRELSDKALLGGGKERIEEQHKKGKLTARERIGLLLDMGSFIELDRLAVSQNIEDENRRVLGDGVVTGHGMIDGRPVFVFAHDFTVFGGSLGETFAMKVCKVMDLAMKT
ncbi:MAG TPA: carboxyl transferase domain-containing protein, partial [Candidatus Dormibacteraeota bacterium]|nr:carboxyl transferase domain-containing protein [Candidatus Dormibacteraeota bacterium]